MIKVIFFFAKQQISGPKFAFFASAEGEDTHDRHRFPVRPIPNDKTARPPRSSGTLDPCEDFGPPVRPFKNPDFPKTGSYLGNIEHSCVATNFDFDPGNFPAQERSTAPFVPQRISFPTGGRFVPAKHRLPGREAGSREGWKNRVQSLSLSRRRHLRRGPAGRRSVPGPKA